MMKIVIINSTGPMGSTSVGSIVEKLGYLNIPVRKLGLNQYLSGKREIDDPLMTDNFLNLLNQHSIERQSGGVSVRLRNSTKGRQLVDKNMVLNYLKRYKKNDKSISDLYSNLRNAYAHGLKYKPRVDFSNAHVEYTTDVFDYDMMELYKAYQIEFDQVYMIHLHRNFVDWLESLLSQRFIHPNFKTRYFFAFRAAFKQFKKYELKVKGLPGLHLDFEKLFLPHSQQTISDIAKYINQPINEILWEEENFDIYGMLVDYQTAFNKADSGNIYISRFTRAVIRFLEKLDKESIFIDMFVYSIYLVESARFQFKYSHLIKKEKK